MTANRFVTLGIESSCDDTSIAVVVNGMEILSNIISSQLDLHTRFGGVVPELAARSHLESILSIYRLALDKAGIGLEEVNLIAATRGPGLIGSLLVGLSFAKGLAISRGIPFIGVHHIEGHIHANFLGEPDLSPPFLCLTVSGGHTDLILMEAWGKYRILGRTRDDAAGEAFDKIARVLGLPYPGGPEIEKLAQNAPSDLEFAQLKGLSGSYDFSFSGLKTAVINYLHRQKQTGIPVDSARVAASFQRIVVDLLLEKLWTAARDYHVRTVVLSGGVAANAYLRDRCRREASRLGLAFFCPKPVLCTDNAAMIAAAGYFRHLHGMSANLDVNASADLPLETVDNSG